MGIDVNGATFLCYARTEGVSFEATAMLGRQNLNVTPLMLRRAIRKFGYREDLGLRLGDYAEPFFRLLGANTIHSIDASGYENASLVHDLNLPIPESWKTRYSTVVDGGTLEHVFDFPRAIRNAMEMIAPGGHYLAMTPGNNFCGHGFYQFSPELYFRVFSSSNGFRMIRMLMYRDSPRTAWYEVADPQEARRRVTLASCGPVYFAVLAQRVDIRPIFAQPPAQSDYARQWNDGSATDPGWKGSPLVRHLYRYLPGELKQFPRRHGKLFRRVDLTRLASRLPNA